MGFPRDKLRCLGSSRHREAFGRHRGEQGIGIRAGSLLEQEARGAIGEGRLACAIRPGEQESMMQLAGGVALQKLPLCGFLSQKLSISRGCGMPATRSSSGNSPARSQKFNPLHHSPAPGAAKIRWRTASRWIRRHRPRPARHR